MTCRIKDVKERAGLNKIFGRIALCFQLGLSQQEPSDCPGVRRAEDADAADFAARGDVPRVFRGGDSSAHNFLSLRVLLTSLIFFERPCDIGASLSQLVLLWWVHRFYVNVVIVCCWELKPRRWWLKLAGSVDALQILELQRMAMNVKVFLFLLSLPSSFTVCFLWTRTETGVQQQGLFNQVEPMNWTRMFWNSPPPTGRCALETSAPKSVSLPPSWWISVRENHVLRK